MFAKMLEPSIGENCSYANRTTTTIDHAVSVVKAETIVRNVPQEMSRTFRHCICHGRSIVCEVTEGRCSVKL